MLFFLSLPYLWGMKMKDLCADERPREKMLLHGASSLSEAELLAILIGSGSSGKNAVEVARELLSEAGGRLTRLSERTPLQLRKQKGIGQARAVTISAALELGRRYLAEKPAGRQHPITQPEEVYSLMLPLLKGLDHEECWVLYLNRANRLCGREKLTSGTLDTTLIDPKYVLRKVLDHQAKGVILVHNHPSGSPLPGEMDLRETRRLHRALQTFDIDLTDHVIIADGSFYSFSRETLVNCD